MPQNTMKSQKEIDADDMKEQNKRYWQAPGVKRNAKGEPLGATGAVLPRPGDPMDEGQESLVDTVKGKAPTPPTPKAPKPPANLHNPGNPGHQHPFVRSKSYDVYGGHTGPGTSGVCEVKPDGLNRPLPKAEEVKDAKCETGVVKRLAHEQVKNSGSN